MRIIGPADEPEVSSGLTKGENPGSTQPQVAPKCPALGPKVKAHTLYNHTPPTLRILSIR